MNVIDKFAKPGRKGGTPPVNNSRGRKHTERETPALLTVEVSHAATSLGSVDRICPALALYYLKTIPCSELKCPRSPRSEEATCRADPLSNR
jgi:hypothetical protein